MSANQDGFTFMGVHAVFKKVADRTKELGEVPIVPLLEAFRDLSRLFDQLGPVFYFVKMDIDGKVQMLEEMYVSGASATPERRAQDTVEKIIRYEVSNNITETYIRSNGSRTILRLVRALDFVAAFMEKAKAEPNLLLREAVQLSYEEKLSQFHSWPARKAVGLATYTLPSREDFLKLLGATPEILVEGGPFDDLVSYFKTVAETTLKTYTEHDLQNLP
eukprot:TRINITY_DN15084_c0_g1_i1.p1 TRINITY_DN15084_c0_g1~~TRINITY_DN15084_c0_g1_i1.p1  ORF type:complete len:219 (-),score=72.25 TRINITY_DN15084_c0_g1_i1:39-695(-)